MRRVKTKVAIAGAGHAAGQAVASLRQKKFDGDIVLIGEEPWLPYQRPPLSKKFLAGELPAERLYVKPPSFYDDPSITVHLGTRVTRIDRGERTLRCEAGPDVRYDSLVLALGARVRRLPPVPGGDLAGIHYLRNVADVERIRAELRDRCRLVIVGAGYIGLEVAAVASQLGARVTVVEMQDRVMKRVVAPPVSAFYEQEHRRHGVELLLGSGLKGFAGDGRVTAVTLADGNEIPADLVVVGIGIVPNVELAADAGLETDDGIVVDEHCRTADPAVYAIGDCTRHPNPLLGRRVRLESVQNALEQARTAAANLCGENARYREVPWFWSDQYDLKLQIAGLSEGYDRTVLRGDPSSRKFACAYLKGERMLAIDAINLPKDFLQSKKLIAEGGAVDVDRLADPAVELKDTAA